MKEQKKIENRKIGIICAVDTELFPFLSYIENQSISERAMLKIYEGNINDTKVAALFCGVGRTNAALAAQLLIDLYGVDVIINCGTAGGMDTRLELFDTVVATEVAYHDVGADILTTFHPWLDSVFFRADNELVSAFRRICDAGGRRIYFGRMVTGEQFIIDEGREEINSKFAPLTVDMETAAIAHVCYVNAIPFAAVRTATDTAVHSGSETFEQNCKRASEISAGIVLDMIMKRFPAGN